MAVQYLQELMSMKLLMNKSDLSAVVFRLSNNIAMTFYLNILQLLSCFQHNKQHMTRIYASFVHLTSN